jgi:hypothetical protein
VRTWTAGAKLAAVDGDGGSVAAEAEVTLVPREPAGSIDELILGATSRQPFRASDGKSGSAFERLEIDGEPCILKTMHVDDDWLARSLGDLLGRSVTVWTSGLLDTVPASIDHTVIGAATGLGRHGWGAALLMRDVSAHLVPEGDALVPGEQHEAFVEHLAEMSARFWGWRDTIGLTPSSMRWSFFGPDMLDVERDLGWPHDVPHIAARGWEAFADRARPAIASVVDELRRMPWVISDAVAATPATLLHGDWKMGNLGSDPDGRTILVDWAYPGEGPACHDLAWYLALNQARLPEPKEDAIARFRAALEDRGVSTNGWWDRQLGLCLLGCLVQFGWEKALGDEAELRWWLDRAAEGAAWL